MGYYIFFYITLSHLSEATFSQSCVLLLTYLLLSQLVSVPPAYSLKQRLKGNVTDLRTIASASVVELVVGLGEAETVNGLEED